jgi:hypothetical protein
MNGELRRNQAGLWRIVAGEEIFLGRDGEAVNGIVHEARCDKMFTTLPKGSRTKNRRTPQGSSAMSRTIS